MKSKEIKIRTKAIPIITNQTFSLYGQNNNAACVHIKICVEIDTFLFQQLLCIIIKSKEYYNTRNLTIAM